MTGSKPRSHYAETLRPSPPPQPWHMFHSTYLVSPASQFGSGRANSGLIKQDDKWFWAMTTNTLSVCNTQLVLSVCMRKHLIIVMFTKTGNNTLQYPNCFYSFVNSRAVTQSQLGDRKYDVYRMDGIIHSGNHAAIIVVWNANRS